MYVNNFIIYMDFGIRTLYNVNVKIDYFHIFISTLFFFLNGKRIKRHCCESLSQFLILPLEYSHTNINHLVCCTILPCEVCMCTVQCAVAA